MMSLTAYCKRLQMEVDLRWIDPVAALPMQFIWVPWDDMLLRDHARVKFHSFRGELDARLFPNLASMDGCVQLMELIRAKPGFLPDATWLIGTPDGCCGTVQGVREGNGPGAIQNLAVVPHCRGLGLGRALLLKALHGFRSNRVKRVELEVSARNRRAVRLYHDVGFIVKKTLYRELIDEPELNFSI